MTTVKRIEGPNSVGGWRVATDEWDDEHEVAVGGDGWLYVYGPAGFRPRAYPPNAIVEVVWAAE